MRHGFGHAGERLKHYRRLDINEREPKKLPIPKVNRGGCGGRI